MGAPEGLHKLAEAMKISQNADQAEALAIANRITAIAESTKDEIVSGLVDDETTGWEQVDRNIEELTGETMEQLQERATRLGSAYPFVIKDSALQYSASQTGVYEFCLHASMADHSDGKGQSIQVQFELLSASMAALMLGSSDWIRTGWPSHDEDERPTNFADLAQLLTSKTGEWHWTNPEDDHLEDTESKDGGLDFVAWKGVDDRAGRLFLIGQCACGQNWRTKISELQVDTLARWWPRVTFCHPVRSFSIPHAIPGKNVIAKLTPQAGIFLDRCRLTLLAEKSPTDHPIRTAKWSAALKGATSSGQLKKMKPTKRAAKQSQQLQKAAAVQRSR